MKVQSWSCSLAALSLTVLSVAPCALAKTAIHGTISRVVDTAHLEFEGMKTWNYEINRTGKDSITLTVPPFDGATEARLNAFSDPFIKSVSIDKNGPDGNYQVTFEVADGSIESFDYLTDDPSRLIIDFYKKPPEAKKPEQQAAKPKAAKRVAAAKRSENSKLRSEGEKSESERDPASDEFLEADSDSGPIESHFGAYDANDANFDRFRVKDYEIREDAILASSKNIYLQFPMLSMPVSRLDDLMKNQPEYVIHEKNERENKEARLLLVLFERGRFNVFLRTFAYFEKKYPQSDYLEILRNLNAQVHLANWKASKSTATESIVDYDLARDAYVQLIKMYPDSPLLERNYLILGYMQLERGEALATLQHFDNFIHKFPKSPEIPQARKAIAQAYLLMHKYDDSLAEYNSISNDFAKTPDGPEAKYRIGDVEFARQNWDGAVQDYQHVIKELPKFAKVFPNASFNMAESMFWKKDYKNSLNEYINFLTAFPTHPYGGYAMTRIGEIMGILGVDPRRSMGAYLESTFRYPDNPGAKVARLRMLTQQMRSMRPNDLKKALEELQDSIHEVHLPGMEEFSTLLFAEGLSDRGAYADSLKLLVDFFQEHPQLQNKDQFTAGILRSIASQIRSDLDGGKFLDALKFKAQYDKTWLHTNHRIDISYFEGRAYEEAGAWGAAEDIYRSVEKELDGIAGTRDEKERRVSEFLPKTATIELRLAAVEAQKRRFAEAYQHLKKIDEGGLNDSERVERVQLIAQVSEFRGEWDRSKAALRDLIKHWKGDQELLNPAYVHLAELDLRTNSYDAASDNLDKALASNNLKDDLRARALELKGDTLLGQKQTMAAVEQYQTLLEEFESKRPLGAIRYKVGRLLFNRGDVKGAENVWGKLQGGNNEIYWDLAKNMLDQAKWQDEYQKYVKRIPAMSSSAKSGESKQ